jgi:hypothetical protein
MGVVTWVGEVYEAKFTPLVTPELFEKVQAVLAKRSKPRKTRHGHDFPFCGIFHCSCGSMLTAQWARGNGGLYRYYRCTRKTRKCSEPYIQEKEVASQVQQKLSPFALTRAESTEIRAAIQLEEDREEAGVKTVIRDAIAELAAIQDKLDRLTRAYLNPAECIDSDSFHRVKEELILRKTALKAEKERLQRERVNSWIEPTRNLINTLETLDNMAGTASPSELAKTLRKIGTNPLISNKTVTFSVGEEYVFLPSLLASARSASEVPTVKRPGDLDQSLRWCPGPDSNRKPID